MKKNSILFKRFFMAFIALTFFFLFACSSDDGDSMDGTWVMDEFELEISGKNYLLKYNSVNETRGTVTYDNSTFKFTIVDEWDWYEEEWVPTSLEDKVISGNYTRNGGVSVFSEVSDDTFNGEWRRK